MTHLPGLCADHCVIDDAARQRRGDAGARDDVLRSLRHHYAAVVSQFPVGANAEIHIAMTVRTKSKPEPRDLAAADVIPINQDLGKRAA